MSRLTRDGTVEPVSRDQILRHARGQGNIHLACSADHEQDWQPYPVDPYSAICDDHTYIHTYIYTHVEEGGVELEQVVKYSCHQRRAQRPRLQPRGASVAHLCLVEDADRLKDNLIKDG